MRKYLIVFGDRDAPRLKLEVFAETAFAADEQNRCLALDALERVEVKPLFTDAELVQADLDYLNGRAARDARRLSLTHEAELAMYRRRGFV